MTRLTKQRGGPFRPRYLPTLAYILRTKRKLRRMKLTRARRFARANTDVTN